MTPHGAPTARPLRFGRPADGSPPAPETEAAPDSRDATDDAALRILAVEDDPADVGLLRAALAASGVATDLRVASDAPSALAVLRAARPDLLLLDLNLPGRSGLELLAELRADDATRSLPVVVLSNSDAPDDRARAERLGIRRFVRKPLDLGDFFVEIAGLVLDAVEWRERSPALEDDA